MKLIIRRQKHKSISRLLVLRFLFLGVFILIVAQVIISNSVSSSGETLQLLEQRKSILIAQNSLLQKKITVKTSIAYIQQTAEMAGLIKSDLRPIIYLPSELNVAVRINYNP